jgi:hypothetical protein
MTIAKKLSEPLVHVLSVTPMRGRTRIIWSRPGNPTRRVATALGITLPQLGDAIHAIKKNARLRPRENVSIWDDGSVTDATDEFIGNIYDEI